MSEDKETKVKDETVLTESEKQEQILRAEFKAKKRRKRIRKIITWIIVIAVLVGGVSLYMNYKAKIEAAQEAALARNTQVTSQVTKNVYTATIDLSKRLLPETPRSQVRSRRMSIQPRLTFQAMSRHTISRRHVSGLPVLSPP